MANYKRYGDIVLTFGSSSSSSSTAGICYGVWVFGSEMIDEDGFYPWDLISTTDDGVLFTGQFFDAGDGGEQHTALIKVVGNEIISFRAYQNLDVSEGGFGYGFCVIEVSDGYVILGKDYDMTPFEEYPTTGTIMNRLIKVNKITGAVIWATQEHTIYADSAGHSLQQTVDGGFIWSSTQYEGGDGYGFGQYTELMFKANSSGVIEWQRAFPYNQIGEHGACRQTADGGYIHAFSGYNNTTRVTLILTKLDSLGTKTWGKQYTISGGWAGYISGFQYTADGGYIIYLTDADDGNSATILKLSSNGTIEWSKKIAASDAANGYYDGINYNIVEVYNGYVFCLMDSQGSKIVKLDLSGNLLWVKLISEIIDDNLGWVNDPRVQLLSDGSLGIAFTTDAPFDGFHKMYCGFVKMNVDGEVPWCSVIVDSNVTLQNITYIEATSTIPANASPIPMVTPTTDLYEIIDNRQLAICDCAAPRVTVIAQSYSATFAKLSNGDMYSAGPNYNGSCGVAVDADFPNSSIVVGMPEYEKVDAFQSHTFFIDSTGIAWFAGISSYGEGGVRYDWIPSDEVNPASYQVTIPTLGPTQGYDLNTTLWTYNLTWNKIAIGGWSVNGIDSTGKLWGWGYNAYGMMGINIPEPGAIIYPFPIACVTAITNWVHVDVGQVLACGIDATHKLYAWGAQGWGEDAPDLIVPTQLGTNTNWIDCQTAEYSFASLNSIGVLYGAGDMSYYMAGETTIDDEGDLSIDALANMVDISDGKYVTQFALGWYHMMILDEDGKLWTRGANWAGQLGIGSDDYNLEEPVWQPVMPNVIFTKIRADYDVSIALDIYNRLWVWGEIPTNDDNSYWVISPMLWEPGGFNFS